MMARPPLPIASAQPALRGDDGPSPHPARTAPAPQARRRLPGRVGADGTRAARSGLGRRRRPGQGRGRHRGSRRTSGRALQMAVREPAGGGVNAGEARVVSPRGQRKPRGSRSSISPSILRHPDLLSFPQRDSGGPACPSLSWGTCLPVPIVP